MSLKIKGWAVQFPSGKLAIEGTSSPLPWVRRTKAEAKKFAAELAAHACKGGKPVRVSVSVSVH
jgi:hypothetical protein